MWSWFNNKNKIRTFIWALENFANKRVYSEITREKKYEREFCERLKVGYNYTVYRRKRSDINKVYINSLCVFVCVKTFFQFYFTVTALFVKSSSWLGFNVFIALCIEIAHKNYHKRCTHIHSTLLLTCKFVDVTKLRHCCVNEIHEQKNLCFNTHEMFIVSQKKNMIQWEENNLCCQNRKKIRNIFLCKLNERHTITHANCHIDKNSCFHNSVKSNQSANERKKKSIQRMRTARQRDGRAFYKKKMKKNNKQKNWLKERPHVLTCATLNPLWNRSEFVVVVGVVCVFFFSFFCARVRFIPRAITVYAPTEEFVICHRI